MKNKLLKSVVYLAVLAIVLAASTTNLLAKIEPSSCSGGQYLNRKEVLGEVCVCGGVSIQQKSCEFQQSTTCNKVTCY